MNYERGKKGCAVSCRAYSDCSCRLRWHDSGGRYTNGFESVKPRYITYANRAVNEKDGLTIGEENAEITLTGAGFTAVDWGDYEVKITVNPAAGINCTTDKGKIELDGEDLTEVFKIVRYERSFVISGGDYRIEKVLKTQQGFRAGRCAGRCLYVFAEQYVYPAEV